MKVILTISTAAILSFYLIIGCSRKNTTSIIEQTGYTSKTIIIDQKIIKSDPISIIKNITFHSPETNRNVGCMIVKPSTDSVKSTVLYLHAYPGFSNEQFITSGEAAKLAQKGIASIHVSGYFPWAKKPIDIKEDTINMIGQIIELRRALDILQIEFNNTAIEITAVGIDYGAVFAALLAQTDLRINSLVFIAGPARVNNFNGAISLSAGTRNYAEKTKQFDPVESLSNIRNIPVLFQFSDYDEWVSVKDAEETSAVVKNSKTIKWYHSGHESISIISENERIEWITALYRNK